MRARRGFGEASATDAAPWYDAWGRLKQIGAQLDEAITSLNANAGYALARPNLAPLFKQKMAEVESMRSKALWLRDAIRSAMSYVGVELQGLGAIPLAAAVVWPAVVAGVTWLGSKALDMWKFSQQVDEQRRMEEKLESSGMPTPQAVTTAAQLTQQKADAGSLTGLLKAATPVLALGLAGVIGWEIWKARR